MRYRGYKIKGIPMLITIIITFIFFFVVFTYFGIEINNNVIIAILLIGIISGLFVTMWQKGKIHQGHFSIITGIIAIAVGVTFLYGIASFNYLDEEGQITTHEKLWDLTPQESGVFVLLVIVGIFSLIGGSKQALANQWSWGWSRSKGR